MRAMPEVVNPEGRTGWRRRWRGVVEWEEEESDMTDLDGGVLSDPREKAL